MNANPAPPPGQNDPVLEALRRIASRQTVRSVKETFLAAILIRAVREQRPRRYNRLAVLVSVVITASTDHLHIWQYLIHLVH